MRSRLSAVPSQHADTPRDRLHPDMAVVLKDKSSSPRPRTLTRELTSDWRPRSAARDTRTVRPEWPNRCVSAEPGAAAGENEQRYQSRDPLQTAVRCARRICFFGGFGPGSSNRNCARSLMAYARTKPFRRQCPMVFIETPQAFATSAIVSRPRLRRRSNRLLSPYRFRTYPTTIDVSGNPPPVLKPFSFRIRAVAA